MKSQSTSAKSLSIEDELSTRDSFFFCALSMLLTRSENSVVPDVMYFMTPDQVLTFMNTFGGRTIKVPTVKEFTFDMHCALAAYYRLVCNWEWEDIRVKLQITEDSVATMNKMKKAVEAWLTELERQGLKLPKFIRQDLPNEKK